MDPGRTDVDERQVEAIASTCRLEAIAKTRAGFGPTGLGDKAGFGAQYQARLNKGFVLKGYMI